MASVKIKVILHDTRVLWVVGVPPLFQQLTPS